MFDVLGQVALASITEPSGHVLVVGVIVSMLVCKMVRLEFSYNLLLAVKYNYLLHILIPFLLLILELMLFLDMLTELNNKVDRWCYIAVYIA